MKKIATLFLAGILCLSICACGNKTGTETTATSKEIKTEADAVGTYRSVGLFLQYECTLNENTTFDIVGNNYQGSTKGTYNVRKTDEIELKPKNNAADIWRKKGKHYYSTDENYLTKVFKKDLEYELKPTFDANGRSNQSFKTGEGDQFNYSEGFELSLNDDGTYLAKHTIFSKVSMTYELEEIFEGTYNFKEETLWLSYQENEYPLLLINDQLYFDVVEKVE